MISSPPGKKNGPYAYGRALTVTVILLVLCLDMQSCMVIYCRHWDAMHCIVVYGTALILAVSSVHQ